MINVNRTNNIVLVGLLVSVLVGCGGGGGSGADSGGGAGDEQPAVPDNNQNALVQLGGIINFAKNLVVDSDIGGSNGQVVANDSVVEAQQLPNNLAKVQGVVGAQQEGDAIDAADVYRVFLQQGQEVKLNAASINDSDQAAEVNIQITVENATSGAQFTASELGKIQQIEIQADADYFIHIDAGDSSTRYLLELLAAEPVVIVDATSSEDASAGVSTTTGSEVSGAQVTPDSSGFNALEGPDYELKQALVKWEGQTGDGYEVVDLTSVYTDSNIDWAVPETTLAAIAALEARSDVLVAEPNYYRYPMLLPNDPQFNASLGLTREGVPLNVQYHYNDINLPQAWDISVGSPEVVVAVIDTGVFLTHPDLDNNLTADGFDFISNATNAKDGDGRDANPDDPGDGDTIATSSWHGTHVAGTVAAETDNGIGGAGVAWESKIMPLRVLGAGFGSTADIIEAIRYAAGLPNASGRLPDQPADIINLSLGSTFFVAAEQEAIQTARDQGVFVVAAAGNNALVPSPGTATPNLPNFPASYDGVISVGATQLLGGKASYSTFNSAVDLAAPGGDVFNGFGLLGILSTFVNEDPAVPGVRALAVGTLQGTSMATPHVAGVIALMKAVYPGLTPDEFDRLLASGVLTDDLGDLGKDDFFGHGQINAEKALLVAQQLQLDNFELEVPELVISQTAITLSDTERATVISVNNSNPQSQNPAVNFATSADWILVDNAATVNGLGDYSITVDTTGFGPGIYQGLIRFMPTAGNSVEFRIELRVGQIELDQPQATHFVMAIDSQSSELVSQTSASNTGRFELELPPGEYRLVAGTDIDADNILCQEGETCGQNPDLLSGQVIDLVQEQTDVELNVSLLDESTPQPSFKISTAVQQEQGGLAVAR